MATTPAQRARARAQRATARAVNEKRRQLPPTIRESALKGRRGYLDGLENGTIPMPAKRSADGDSLASLAGRARWGKADKKYEGLFKQYWYHKSKKDKAEQEEADADADALESPDEEDEEDE